MATISSTLPSICSKTSTLVLACFVPTVIGFATLSYDAYTRQKVQLVADAERMAQALLAAVERDLFASEVAARALAGSPSLAGGDLAAFRSQAASLLTPDFPAFAFVLSAPHGSILADTRYPLGAVLPPNRNAAGIARVAASGAAAASSLVDGDGEAPARVVTVDVPVRVDGKVRYVLSALLRPERFNALLHEQRLPAGWNAQVFDHSAVFVARSSNPQLAVGRQANVVLVDAMARQASGVVEMTSRENQPVLAAYRRSAQLGWFVSVGVPRDAARGVLNATLPAMLAAIGALLAVGFATAWTMGGTISRSVRALSAPAVALGRGEALDLADMRIRETAEVAGALRQLEGELQRYRSGLERLVGERTAELERSNALLATVYATAPVGMILLDSDLRVVMVNDYLAGINGIPVQDHLGRSLPDLFGPAGEQYEQPFRDVRDSGVALPAVAVNTTIPTAPQVKRHLIVGYHPVRGSDGQLVGISAVILDVSERELLAQRLHDVDEQFRALYDMSGDAHTLVAQGSNYIGGNLAAARLFGCASVEEFLTLSPASTSPEYQPDGRLSAEKADQFVRFALETGSHHFEWLHQRRDGSRFHADVLLTRLTLGGKGVLQGTVRDISARIAAEHALRATSERLERSERFIRTVADNVPGMVGYWDATLRCQFANRSYLESFGLTEEQLLGRPIDQVLTPAQLAENAPHLREVCAGRAAHFAQEKRDAAGEVRHTWSSYIPDLGEDGSVRGFYVLVSDVTDLKRSELRLQSLNEQLIGALDRAEMASSAKTEFLANMSHEIRTPMNAIMGLARLLEEAPLGRREREYVTKMAMSTRSLLGILNDVLDFSKIEAGQLELEYTAFTLEQVLRGVSVLVEPNAFGRGIELVFDVAPEVPDALHGDPMRLEQVLLNLIGNAIKFTEQGEVVLGVRVLEREDDEVRLGFTVRDTGIGIAADKQQTLFDAFSQGDSSTSRRFGGAGLGLAICRRLVGMMGGTIGVTSQLGQGASFQFDARFGAAASDAAPVAAHAERRLLLVDENASARAALAAQCQAHGWEVDAIGAPEAALERLRGGVYGLVLADSAMPGMDGISLLTRARGEAGPAGLPPVALLVAESARARLDDMAPELQLGAVIGKPVTPGALAAALDQLCNGAAPPAIASAPALAGRLAGLYVLLVEDNQINQEVAHYILLHAGAAVDMAANGRIAVDMLAEHPTRYDAVLMDVQMPVMDGYQATEEIRRLGFATLPVIAMTANAMEDDRVQAINAGMNAHVAKPIDVDNLVDALLRVTGGTPPQAVPAPVAVSPGPAPIPGIDLGPTLQRFGGDHGAFVSLLKRFESSQGGTLEEVRGLVAAGRFDAALPLVHRLRGVAANLGAVTVASLALQVEQELRGGAVAPGLLARLDEALADVFAQARALPLPAGVPGAAREGADLQRALADLLALLQNNNLKAMAAFQALRPALDELMGPAQAAAVNEAIATLAFANAAASIEGLLARLDGAAGTPGATLKGSA